MSRFIITKPFSWGNLGPAQWASIINYIAKGSGFGIWCGRYSDKPKNWKEGKCCLVVKVGKKRKLVKGTVTLEYEGYDDGGETYSYHFTPSKPRILTRKLHPDLYSHITDQS